MALPLSWLSRRLCLWGQVIHTVVSNPIAIVAQICHRLAKSGIRRAVGSEIIGILAHLLIPLGASSQYLPLEHQLLMSSQISSVDSVGLSFHSPVNPNWPQARMLPSGPRAYSGCQVSPSHPPVRSAPKMPSNCLTVSLVIGLSLWTKMAR